jgi:hypothetical protein
MIRELRPVIIRSNVSMVEAPAGSLQVGDVIEVYADPMLEGVQAGTIGPYIFRISSLGNPFTRERNLHPKAQGINVKGARLQRCFGRIENRPPCSTLPMDPGEQSWLHSQGRPGDILNPNASYR